MKKTGQLLKDKRESANLSLSEVALATKINPKVLTAIENGDEANLPAKTFLKGFVRSYALFLKMDVDEVLRSFQDETGGKPVERIHEAYAVKPEGAASGGSSRRRVGEENSSSMRTAAVVVIVLLIGLIIGVRELIEKYQREKITDSAAAIKVSPLIQPPVVSDATKPASEGAATNAAPSTDPQPSLPAAGSSPAPTPPPPVPLPAPAPVVEKKPDPIPEKKPEPAPAPKPVVEKKTEPAPAPTPPPAPAPVAEKKPEPVKAPETKPEVKVEETKAETTKPAKVAKSEIILEALDKVDVKMQIKGQTKLLSLGPNQVHTIHTDQPVAFDFSDGGAVNIIVNGHERGVPGDLGKPKQITIP